MFQTKKPLQIKIRNDNMELKLVNPSTYKGGPVIFALYLKIFRQNEEKKTSQKLSFIPSQNTSGTPSAIFFYLISKVFLQPLVNMIYKHYEVKKQRTTPPPINSVKSSIG